MTLPDQVVSLHSVRDAEVTQTVGKTFDAQVLCQQYTILCIPHGQRVLLSREE